MQKLDKTVNAAEGAVLAGSPLPSRRWASPRRVYAAWLERDLLGDLVLVAEWGGRASRLGGSQSVPVGSLAEGLRRLNALDRRRRAHGYAPLA